MRSNSKGTVNKELSWTKGDKRAGGKDEAPQSSKRNMVVGGVLTAAMVFVVAIAQNVSVPRYGDFTLERADGTDSNSFVIKNEADGTNIRVELDESRWESEGVLYFTLVDLNDGQTLATYRLVPKSDSSDSASKAIDLDALVSDIEDQVNLISKIANDTGDVIDELGSIGEAVERIAKLYDLLVE